MIRQYSKKVKLEKMDDHKESVIPITIHEAQTDEQDLEDDKKENHILNGRESQQDGDN